MSEQLDHTLDRWGERERSAGAHEAPLLDAVRARRRARRAGQAAACALLVLAAAAIFFLPRPNPASPQRPPLAHSDPPSAPTTPADLPPTLGALRAQHEHTGEPAPDWDWSLAWTRSASPL